MLAFASMVIVFTLASSVGLVVLWRLRRRNRVHPQWPTMAPLSWLVHPGTPARLHRRLRHAVATAQYRSPGKGRHRVPGSSVDELIAELLHEAAGVDEQLVLADRAPRAIRKRILGVTIPQVAKLEAIAARLAILVSASARPGGVPAANALLALEDRLDAIEVSRQEIADLEAALQVDLVAQHREISDTEG
ncbi:MAG: hypothetical protein QOI47_1115 [Actinomycetota bacterium]|jgi:hypothetical protein|nr:hypothetical protein [Actinomycetota bacterium]